ncbi:MAG: hypothetical protein Q9M94_00435, partial [Candidatus Gracilibacteria bacterium]|nr:hypothetical protein [Candidatus Gracilibacteria bacterium]
ILNILIFLLYIPFSYIEQYNNYKIIKIKKYIEIENKVLLKNDTTEQDKIDYVFLDKEFSKYSNEELVENYNKYYIIKIIYNILYFIFILGIFDLVITLFYKNEIKQNIASKIIDNLKIGKY